MAEPTPADRLAGIRARLEAAPRGPWVIERLGELGYPQGITNGAALVIATCFEEPTYPLTVAPFIAESRTDVEVLLDIVEAVLAAKPSMHNDHGPIPLECRFCEGEAAGLAKVQELIGNHLTCDEEETTDADA